MTFKEKDRIKGDWFETIVYEDEDGNEKYFSVKKYEDELGIAGDFYAGEMWIDGKDLDLLRRKMEEWFEE